jgi:hypothetical protein
MVFVSAVVLLNGCASTTGTKHASSSPTITKTNALVLFRVVRIAASDAGPAGCDFQLSLWPLDGSKDEFILPGSQALSSKTAADAGWRCVPVPPGNYYATLTPRDLRGSFLFVTKAQIETNGSGTRTNISASDTREPTSYFLSVPKGSPVVYAGTFFIIGPSMAFAPMPPAFALDRIENDIASAREVATEAGWSNTVARTAVPYDDLGAAAKSLSATAIGTVESGDETKISVKGKGSGHDPAKMAATPFLWSGIVLLEGSGSGSGNGAWIVPAAGLAMLVAAVPVYGVTKGIAWLGHKDLKPAELLFKKEVTEFNPAQHLAEAFNAHLTNAIVAETNPVPAAKVFSLRVEPYRVCLRGVTSQKFALECGVRVSLIDVETKTLVWQNSYVRSDEKAWYRSRLPGECLIQKDAPVRRLKEYEGEPGAELLRADLNQAIEEMTGEIVVRFEKAGFIRLSPPENGSPAQVLN